MLHSIATGTWKSSWAKHFHLIRQECGQQAQEQLPLADEAAAKTEAQAPEAADAALAALSGEAEAAVEAEEAEKGHLMAWDGH